MLALQLTLGDCGSSGALSGTSSGGILAGLLLPILNRVVNSISSSSISGASPQELMGLVTGAYRETVFGRTGSSPECSSTEYPTVEAGDEGSCSGPASQMTASGRGATTGTVVAAALVLRAGPPGDAGGSSKTW